MPSRVQAAPAPTRARRLAPPRSLACLLLTVTIVGLAWALLVPPWQSPDELAHFAYVQSLAENFRLPSVPGRPEMSSDQSFADGSVGASRGAFFSRFAPPDWSHADWKAYLAVEHGARPPSRTNGSGSSTASGNPPLYYLYGAAAYRVDEGGTAFGRLYAIRIAGVLLLLLTTLGAWLLAGEVFGRRRLPQVTCAAVTGLLPMTTFMSTSVNPDAMLIALWTVALWLGARVINRRATGWTPAALCAVTAAAVLTKATSYALVGPVLLALLLGWLRQPRRERVPALRRLVPALLVLAAPILAWVSVAPTVGGLSVTTAASSPAHPFNVRQFLSYVWQFYLPRLPFLTPFRTTPPVPAYYIWVQQGTGVFGWLDISLPPWVYRASEGVLSGTGLWVLVRLALLRDRARWALVAFFALTVLALLVLLHVVEYKVLIAGGGQFLQGRYLLPISALLGLGIALAVAHLPQATRPGATGIVVTVMLSLQVISLAAVLQGYYL